MKSTYLVCDGYGNGVADGLQDERQAVRIANDRLAADSDPYAVYVVYDRADGPCVRECVGAACRHEVYRAERA